jgi:hypothetical protein
MSVVVTEIVTKSGARKILPPHVNLEIVAGLDEEGRIVVDNFDAFHAPYVPWTSKDLETYVSHPFLFGLTLCCDAYDKGMEDGIYCRACYGEKMGDEAGHYLYKAEDGSFPGLDPVEVVLHHTVKGAES